MSDVFCRRCGEPWDLDSIHERVSELHENGDEPSATFDSVYAAFRRIGCEALEGYPCQKREVDPIIGVITDALGDDVDGAAAEYADFVGPSARYFRLEWTQAAKPRRPKPVSRISTDQGTLL